MKVLISKRNAKKYHGCHIHIVEGVSGYIGNISDDGNGFLLSTAWLIRFNPKGKYRTMTLTEPEEIARTEINEWFIQ